MGTIRFILRDDKQNKDGHAALQMVYQLSGQRRYCQLKQKILPANWDSETQQAVYLDKKQAKTFFPEIPYSAMLASREADELNATLASYRKIISNLENRFALNKQAFSVSLIIEAFKKELQVEIKTEAPSNQVFDFIEQYITDNKTSREAGSLIVYKSLRTHLEKYQSERRKKISFDMVDYAFFQDFQNFLIERRNLSNTTVAKQLSTLKTFLNYATLRGIQIPQGYRNFKIKRSAMEVIALTNDEFERLYTIDLNGNRRLEQVRDVFCFACATGLRYSDLAQLQWQHIKGDSIKLTVKKTKELLTIPLNPFSFAIIEKYKDSNRPLPIISNQKMNLYLKGGEIKQNGHTAKIVGLCELAGINEPVEIVRYRGAKREAVVYSKFELVGVHTARKTFATLSLEKGMSAEETMTITGHRDYKSFSRYVKVTEERKKIVMGKAWGRIGDK